MTKSKIEKKVLIRNNWRAGYIEMCKSGSEGGIQRPALRTKQGVGCLPRLYNELCKKEKQGGQSHGW